MKNLIQKIFSSKRFDVNSLMVSYKVSLAIFSFITILISSSCKKLVDVEAPTTTITSEVVFNSNATAIAVMTNLYSTLSLTGFPATSMVTANTWTSLSSDELSLWDGTSDPAIVATYQNNLRLGGPDFWLSTYNHIYICNSVIEGITSSNKLTEGVKDQLMGEAKFMRAYFYFHLVNLYGDVPLALSTDYKVNSLLGRVSKNDIYKKIINDLIESEKLLSENYRDISLLKETQERVRPNKWAAASLLARVYLFNEQWENAKNEATLVINRTNLYDIANVPLNDVFLANSNEAIWQLQPVNNVLTNTNEGRLYIIPQTGQSDDNPFSLSDALLREFEKNDMRRANWVDSVNIVLEEATATTAEVTKTYFFPNKYKVNTLLAPVTEYTMVLRLAEVYLIRSEAEAHLSNFQEAKNDLNIIRHRANLPNTLADNQPSLLTAILHERQIELFTEGCHRWFDLKRTNLVDEVMGKITPLKGGIWDSNWQVYPIPYQDILKDKNLIQNPGY